MYAILLMLGMLFYLLFRFELVHGSTCNSCIEDNQRRVPFVLRQNLSIYLLRLQTRALDRMNRHARNT